MLKMDEAIGATQHEDRVYNMNKKPFFEKEDLFKANSTSIFLYSYPKTCPNGLLGAYRKSSICSNVQISSSKIFIWNEIGEDLEGPFLISFH
jgi:hypothetical protein